MKRGLYIALGLVLFIGCGDGKSTGEKMAEAVKKIREDRAVAIEPAPSTSATSVSNPKIEENSTTKEPEKNITKELKAPSLREIAIKAKEEIKEAAKPTKELARDVKDIAQITKESAKEAIDEAKDSVVGFIKGAKESIKEEFKEVKEKIEKKRNVLGIEE
jgi:hypothetical protein